eukprot:11171026-Lingulodinium_polyedra.AAC.1
MFLARGAGECLCVARARHGPVGELAGRVPGKRANVPMGRGAGGCDGQELCPQGNRLGRQRCVFGE